MFNIPMGSMISAMSETDEERASLFLQEDLVRL